MSVLVKLQNENETKTFEFNSSGSTVVIRNENPEYIPCVTIKVGDKIPFLNNGEPATIYEVIEVLIDLPLDQTNIVTPKTLNIPLKQCKIFVKDKNTNEPPQEVQDLYWFEEKGVHSAEGAGSFTNYEIWIEVSVDLK